MLADKASVSVDLLPGICAYAGVTASPSNRKPRYKGSDRGSQEDQRERTCSEMGINELQE
jgi:hypothetical protein